MGALIKFILEFILIFWLLRALLRLAAPFIFRSFARKAAAQAERFYHQQGQQHYTNNYHNNNSGEMHINQNPEKSKIRKANLDNAGDFVDYEEIK